MHSFFLFKKSKTPESFQKSLCVVESGLYKYSRNPMYVGFVFILAGIALLLGNIASFISPLLMIAVLNWMFIPYEEEKMEIECREQYLQYKQRVRRWL